MIYDVCGGLLPGRTLQAVIPGGSSAKVLRADERFKGTLKDGTDFDWGIDDIPWILMAQWLPVPCPVRVVS